MKEHSKELDLYGREIMKDKLEIIDDRRKFVRDINMGLGKEMTNINNYIKKPSRWKKFWAKVKKVLWNV